MSGRRGMRDERFTGHIFLGGHRPVSAVGCGRRYRRRTSRSRKAWEEAVTRRRLSTRDRVAVYKDNGGICHICGGHIDEGQGFEVSHPIPLELGGTDDKSNWRPAHKKCHAKLTAEIDIPNIAKAKRREAVHLGAKAPSSRPMPGSKASGWRKPFNKPAERRT